ncbi:GerAB/ArcD/ProY family transporter [Paenibacillus koleovorans]|uniref:GerAB/ArcD/ProY family transporter n=1 Tax=Paenibacillus koleovorans TaxID=121608 RepID=UPI000FD8AD5A|nr:GerAB/ArcD/ProY family transporter [Paenibacillus koleovorans]
MSTSGSSRKLLPPYTMLYLMQGCMVGVGILNFQQKLVQRGSYDSWLAVLLVGLSIQLIVWMCYKLLGYSEQEPIDLLQLHALLFGKAAGWLLNAAVSLYFFAGAAIVSIQFIEVARIWIFPLMTPFLLFLLLALVVYYAVSGGIHTVAGFGFWGVIIPFLFLIVMLVSSTRDLHISNMIPVFHHSPADMMAACKTIVFEFIGFEILLMCYPWMQSPKASQKWAHLAVGVSSFLYLGVALISFMYFSEGLLQHTTWPTLMLVKMIEIPIYQRMEYILIMIWFLKIAASISILLWAVCRGLKRTLKTKLSINLLLCLTLLGVLFGVLQDHAAILRYSSLYGKIGFGFIYGYIPILFAVMLVRKWRRRSR